ncbi:MAG: FGGY-family carbohydrate kinase [Candidatus Hydrogenedentes bacterium]|nr:FGGY-family carbohydrate kinase [Candidatus Hydrogenedentota bacterium]
MTNASKYFLAIDLGTGGPKTAVVSTAGEILGTGKASVETIHLPEGGAEQDPAAVWDAVKASCKDALSTSAIDPKAVVGVMCASQYSSVIPVDRDGNHTMNMVVWMDRRGAARKLKKETAFPKRADNPWQLYRWLRIHGLPPVGDGNDTLSHMRWIKFARPEVYARTAVFLEPMDFVALKFTGRAVANQCTAFMMLLTDNRKLNVTEYHERLVAYSLIDREKLPELVPIDSVIGTVKGDVAAELGLSPETEVIAGVNDTQIGGIVTGAFKGTHAGISVGTTSVMITHVDFKKTDVRHAILSMPSPLPNKWFVMAENGAGGLALEHFLQKVIFPEDAFGMLTTEDKYRALGRAVDTVEPGSKGLLFLPWMSGSIAPVADGRMRSGFLNIDAQTTRSQMARAVLEGVSLNLRWLRPAVERFAKRPLTHFVFYGGGALMDEWAQIMADVLYAPIHQMENPRYANCLGCAMLGFHRLGHVPLDEIEKRVPIKKIYQPREAHKQTYDKLYKQFVASFKRTRPIFRALNAPEH